MAMAHFSKHLVGATRLKTTPEIPAEGQDFEYSAYVKGDSLIVMAIDTTQYTHNLKITLPFKVKSGTTWLSTGNGKDELCQKIAAQKLSLTAAGGHKCFTGLAQGRGKFLPHLFGILIAGFQCEDLRAPCKD